MWLWRNPEIKKQGFIWDGGGLCVCGLRGGGRSVLERDEEKV